MPQAAVPDINVSIIRYREVMLRSRQERDPAGVWFAIQALNGTLDGDLQLSFIPRAQYNLMRKARHSTHCGECDAPVALDMSSIKSRPAGWALRMTGKAMDDTIHVKCPQCEAWQHLDLSKADVDVEQPSPLELDVLPMPPQHSTMSELVYNEPAFWQWADLVVYVIEDRMRKFRAKYRVNDGEITPVPHEDDE